MSIGKRSDLFREYARVIDMCEGTEVEPWLCVRVKGFGSFDKQPDFTADHYRYDFAVAILEGKPVFMGDVVYDKLSGSPYTVNNDTIFCNLYRGCTWNKPKKRTFTLAGGVLPMPVNGGTNSFWLYVGKELYYFDTPELRNDFDCEINKIINEAIENAKRD